jgi:hypothetical protein
MDCDCVRSRKYRPATVSKGVVPLLSKGAIPGHADRHHPGIVIGFTGHAARARFVACEDHASEFFVPIPYACAALMC